MNDAAPESLSLPVVDEIEVEQTPFAPNDSPSSLNLELPNSNQIEPGDFEPIDQIPNVTVPDSSFKPFNRDVFKVKSKIENVMPLEEQSSILIDKVSESHQPDLSSFAPTNNLQLQLSQGDEPETNNFQIPGLNSASGLSLEQTQTEITEKVEDVAEALQPYLSQAKPAAELALPAPKEAVPVNETFTPDQAFAPVAQPMRQTETVVEGELYEDPVVLYARQRRDMLTATPIQKPGAVTPVSAKKPIEHQSIVQNSEFDPIYGLPLTNDVQFDSLPAPEQPPVAPSNQAQHLHVHIHHDYNKAATGPVHQIQQTGQQARNVQVVYRDDEGRIIMAPPTPTATINSAEPTGDQRTYYVPPEQILRLKATSPISRQRSNPSVATIQMRDTIIHGGTHLLATPDYQAKPVMVEHGLPGINYDRLQEAFKPSPTDNPLR